MKRVIGCILLLFGISGVPANLTRWAGVDTEYERTALFIETLVLVVLVLWGLSLVRSHPKPRAESKPEGDDRPA